MLNWYPQMKDTFGNSVNQHAFVIFVNSEQVDKQSIKPLIVPRHFLLLL